MIVEFYEKKNDFNEGNEIWWKFELLMIWEIDVEIKVNVWWKIDIGLSKCKVLVIGSWFS